jgi:hypothetical protein
MAVYLLHSTVPLVRESGAEVRHYLGYCDEGNLPHRLWEHRTGRHSARIVQAFLQQGGELWLGNYWAGLQRDDERRMKSNGHLESKCLLCQLDELLRMIADRHGTAGLSAPMLLEQSSRQSVSDR